MSIARPNDTPISSYQAQYQTLYNQTLALKKEYQTVTDTSIKDAMRVVLMYKISKIQELLNTYNLSVNTQLQELSNGV